MTASLAPRQDAPTDTVWRLRIWGRLIAAGLVGGGGWGAVAAVIGYDVGTVVLGIPVGAAFATAIALVTAALLAVLPDRAALSPWTAPLTGAVLACAGQYAVIGVALDDRRAFLHPGVAACAAATAAVVAGGFLWAVRGARR
ncbi:hypothetical protein ABT093_11285 [Kitasatospora sp. NPDC002551]|uniref:hypothetical protein n=1 Tax=unclassified Kitasatospora TaxID=2633591 RepID=UPI00332650A4